MTDHGHRVDGSTESSLESVGADASERPQSDAHERPQSDAHEHPQFDAQTITNVVPFPRDWFGPIEDLEPIDLDPPAASAVSAAAFWDEDAGAVHQLVEFPDGEAPDRDEVEPDPAHPFLSGQRFDADGSTTARRSPVTRISLAFLGLLALLAAGSALVLASGLLHHRAPSVELSHSPSRHRQTSPSPARQVTVTATVTTATLTTAPKRTRRHRAARSTAPVKATSRSKAEQPRGTHAEAPFVRPRSETPASAAVRSGHPVSSGSAGTSRSSGRSVSSGCVQSPDSGCLP